MTLWNHFSQPVRQVREGSLLFYVLLFVYNFPVCQREILMTVSHLFLYFFKSTLEVLSLLKKDILALCVLRRSLVLGYIFPYGQVDVITFFFS